ncbi:MAG: ubiquinol-cytochrome c reductase iron-sulfur subunit [Deltaproteobacteria bacterium]|nr:ubiquinol-cytochrome c reductase iron-sulfur subunit [Deltaproteobacteria bacterium]
MSRPNVLINDENWRKELVDTNRRAFIKTAALAGGAAILTGIPLASYVIVPALKKGAGKWVDFGTIDDLVPENFTMLSYEFMVKDGWLVLPQRGFVWARFDLGGRIKIFSSTCTHLACNVIWQEETKVFECPCHSGRYDAQGQPIAGPPTKPLSVLEHKVEDRNLQVYMVI